MLSRQQRARQSRRVLSCALAGAAMLTVPAVALLRSAPPARADSVRSAQQWVLDAINAPAAWSVSKGRGVTVAVIDSGVNGDVADLRGVVTSGPDYTGVHTSARNQFWGVHGTWMASLIAGRGHGTDHASGIMGVAPESRILSVRVITDKHDPGYGRYERQPLRRGQQELALAIRYAVAHHADVISMSLGYGAPSLPVRAALQEAFAHRVVVVASSGNSGTAADAQGPGTAPDSFPADYPGVIGVGAVGHDWQPASFSSENLSVHVAAPGVNVPAQGRDGQYWLVSGTSPACALTAGVAALIKARYPRLSDAQVGYAITTSAWHRPRGGPDEQVGFGTVNAAAALVTARRLSRQGQASHTVSATRHFGGGSRAIPAPPVQPRGMLPLVLFCLLGALCLAAIAFAAIRLVSIRQPALAAARPPGPLPPTPGWGLLPRDANDADKGWRPPASPAVPPPTSPGPALPCHQPGPAASPGRPAHPAPDGAQPGYGHSAWQPPPPGRHAAPPDPAPRERGGWPEPEPPAPPERSGWTERGGWPDSGGWPGDRP